MNEYMTPFLSPLLSKPLDLKCYFMDSYVDNHLGPQFTMDIDLYIKSDSSVI